MNGKKFKAIRDILYEELFSPICEDEDDLDGTVYIPAGTEGVFDEDYNDGYVGMYLDESIRNPYDKNMPAVWLAVPKDAFEEVK